MPIHRGQDKTGSFYQWGQTGKKYYFDPENTSSKTRALNKAKAQQTAIYSSGWKGDQRMAMKLIKVRRGDDQIDELEDKIERFCLEKENLIKKVANKDPGVDVVFERNVGLTLFSGVNWPARGRTSWKETKKFAQNLLKVCAALEAAEKEARTRFPELK